MTKTDGQHQEVEALLARAKRSLIPVEQIINDAERLEVFLRAGHADRPASVTKSLLGAWTHSWGLALDKESPEV